MISRMCIMNKLFFNLMISVITQVIDKYVKLLVVGNIIEIFKIIIFLIRYTFPGKVLYWRFLSEGIDESSSYKACLHEIILEDL